ncbi:MAG: exodeoxyribonuclease VII small subunit [Clostridia bacterium]|nr:exodeoxyribonuclease VII small subunit [Clostridia bacterium]
MKSNELNFEEAIEKLEAIVAKMESGTSALDDSLADFEEGVRLIRICTAKLEAAEQKVKILIGKDGELVEDDFHAKD